MGEATIICPNCKKSFEISDAIQHQIEDELRISRTWYKERNKIDKGSLGLPDLQRTLRLKSV